MKQTTWPGRSEGSRFAALSFPIINGRKEEEQRASKHRSEKFAPQIRSHSKASSSIEVRDFSMLPYDVLTKIAASFSLPNLRAASLVCKSWCDGLRPLREGMVFLRWGKRFKHGKGGVRPNLDKALGSFLKGAARGSTLAMVDAGLVYWETGKKDKAVALYKRAAVLGDPAGQFNLGVSYLQAKPPNPKEAVKWFYQSANAGYARAQYQLGLCLLHGRGVDKNKQEAARWYLKAAEGGYLRAMYNISLCYSFGEGFGQNHRLARKWMKRAADSGHTKAQYEHGVALFSSLIRGFQFETWAGRGSDESCCVPGTCHSRRRNSSSPCQGCGSPAVISDFT